MTEPETTKPGVQSTESGSTEKTNGSETSAETNETPSAESTQSAQTGSPAESKAEPNTEATATSEAGSQQSGEPHLRSAVTMADPMQSNAGKKANPLLAFIVLGGTVAIAGFMGSFLWRDGGQETPGADTFRKIDDFARDNFRQKSSEQKPVVGADWRRKAEDEQKIFEMKLAQIDQDYFKKSGAPNDHTRRDVILYLGDAYRKAENQWPMVEKYYLMAYAMPEDGPHTAAHPISRMELGYHLGECYFNMQRYPLAEQYLKQAYDEPSRVNLSENAAQFWKHEIQYLQAETLMQEGKLAEAEKILNERKQIDQDPYSKALIQRDFGILFAKQGKLEDAEKQFAAALSAFDGINGTNTRDPIFDNDRKVAVLLDEYASLLRQKKKPEEAYAFAHRSRAIRDNPPPGMIVPK